MDNNMFQRLKDLVTQHQQVGVIVSPNPTFDEMAAGLGMYLVLKQMGKNVSIACPTDPTVAISSLVGIDQVKKSFGTQVVSGPGGDLVVSFPYREGEIEKVSYTVDNGKLNIVVKAGVQGLSFTQSDVQYQQGSMGAGTEGSMPSLLFLVGVADPMSITSILPQSTQGVTIVNIDNKINNSKYGDVVHVDTKFSSVSEEVADFLTLLEPQIELDRDTSQNLLSGILSANNDFEGGKGSYLAFEMAGILMKKGAVRSATGLSHPVTPPMQTSSYFPPQQQVSQTVPQPMQQPSFQPMNQPFNNIQPQQSQPFTSPQVQQPVQQPQPMSSSIEQPSQPQQNQNQQGNTQQDSQQEPPSDWLTPKVYKGSTVL